MRKLEEPKETLLSIKYKPCGGEIHENPPRFTWLPEAGDNVKYDLYISKNPEFSGDVIVLKDIPYNFTTLNHTLEAGKYFWKYGVENQFSTVREFSIAEDSTLTPVPSRETRFEHVDKSHPRIWMNKEQINAFKRELRKDENYCGFKDFLEKSVYKYANQKFTDEPARYPNDKRVVHLWRGNYTACQEAMEYIRSLSTAGVILENEQYIKMAKEALLCIIDWDLNGSTSRDYNDECSFRVAYAVAFGYDWLYDKLSEEERERVREVLYLRTKQVADHVMIDSKIHYSLYDSHAVRSLSSVLTPCCIAMLFENDDARRWLNYTIDYLSVIYTPWGGEDGGWAEGVMYWGSGMAFLIYALDTLKAYTGINLYDRPFFQKTGDFQMYCNPAGTYRASFCDQSNLGRMAGHKQAFNIRRFASTTGNGNYYKYYKEVFKLMPQIENAFYNNGWWDFNYDEMTYRYYAKDVSLKENLPIEKVKWFKDVGWVAINKDMFDYANHIFMLTKSSPYGSVSHSHGDQNAFVLFAYGEPLVIKSGYYIGFNTSMHRDWRRQTKSHNAVLINGQGQYAGMDKALQFAAKGRVCEVTENDQYVYIKEDAAEAYKENVPDIKTCEREIYFVQDSYFVIVDTVETENDSDIDFMLHSLDKYEIDGHNFIVNRERARLKGSFLFSHSGIESISQTDDFDNVNPAEIEGLDKQWHLKLHTGKSKKHKLVTLLVPEKTGETRTVTPIKDDQGMHVYYYFNYDGQVFTLKAFQK
ncbi:MAG: DUF4962 domain-containing protein [Eubacteriales bacterium]|nr:DUF4962 domain-containing protein [Eubacteriales bacterium]